MYHHPAILFSLSLIFPPLLLADDKLSLEHEEERISYAIGHQIGKDFLRQNVDLDSRAITRGIEHGHQGGQPLMDPQEMQRRLVKLKRNITDDTKARAMERVKKREAEMKHRKEIGREFLAANKEKTGIVTTESGLQYRVITEGSGVSPKLTDRVRIRYKSSRLNGQVINSSKLKGGPRVFPVNGLIPGVTEALRLMRPGAKWELYLPHRLAFGRQGPFAHEAIITEVELLEILPPEAAQAAQAAADPTAGSVDSDEGGERDTQQ